MYSMNLISVIVPVYRAEKYLDKCIQSLCRQTYHNFEVILVDDGSPDRCGEICDHYAKEDPTFRAVHQKNAGVSSARNAGIREAKGRYITFVDADDSVFPEYLSVLEQHMRPGGMAICGFSGSEYDAFAEVEQTSKKTDLFTKAMTGSEAQRMTLRLDGIEPSVCCKMFDKAVIDKYRISFSEDISIGEDYLFQMEYLSHVISPVVWTNQPLYYYCQNSASAMHRMWKKAERIPSDFPECQTLERIKRYLDGEEISEKLWEIRSFVVKRRALQIMAINGWKDHPKYREYLKFIRDNLILFLRYDIGQPLRAKAGACICCINPKLECMVRSIFKKSVP